MSRTPKKAARKRYTLADEQRAEHALVDAVAAIAARSLAAYVQAVKDTDMVPRGVSYIEDVNETLTSAACNLRRMSDRLDAAIAHQKLESRHGQDGGAK
jgi:hypothetical protein